MKWNELSLFDRIFILTILFTIGLVTFSILRVGYEVLIGVRGWEVGFFMIGTFLTGIFYYHLINMVKSCIKIKRD